MPLRSEAERRRRYIQLRSSEAGGALFHNALTGSQVAGAKP